MSCHIPDTGNMVHESKMPEPVFIFWAADGEHIRLWTKDRFRALRFATDSGVEAQVYVPAENVTAASQEATRQAMERTLSICRQMEERGYDAKDCAEAIEDAIRALLPPTSPTSEDNGNG